MDPCDGICLIIFLFIVFAFFIHVLSLDQEEEKRREQAKKAELEKQKKELKAEKEREFYQKVHCLPVSKMMDPVHYGKIQESYWNLVRSFPKNNVVQILLNYKRRLASGDIDQIATLNIDEPLLCAWFFATEKPYSAVNFGEAVSVFNSMYHDSHIDICLAECYAFKQMGANDILRKNIQEILKKTSSANQLESLASGLMWMQAYQEESMVLKHMLANGIPMSPKAQERLRSLTTGGGNAPSTLNVTGDDASLHFDVSALAWSDNDYSSLFDNLAFQDQKLTYALAVRDETKVFTLPSAITLPNHPVIIQKLSQIFTEDYGNLVSARSAAYIAHSGATQENMNCILIQSAECLQMGILVYISKIGKRINIKFYTLFIPSIFDIAVQKQQAISLYKKLSPSVSGWEESIKENVLKGIQELLNSGSNPTPGPGPVHEPIF